jgi:DNA-binding winged helix-turn-helix (wHTH) protein/tetratricopeptide (TPR) repeat protein
VTEPAEIRFDGWRLRISTGELSREGQPQQRLTQQPLRILLELLRNPGEVVTRERLVEILWPKGVVDYDNGLHVAVRKLRVALGDESDTPRYIETLPRVGYRFVGKLESAEPVAVAKDPANPPKRTHWVFAGGIVGGAVLLVLWLIQVTPSAPDPVEPAATTAASTAPIVARRTTSVRAYEHYLQGIYHRSRRDADGTRLSIAELEAALAEDPEYAEAWAGLSETYVGAAIGHSIPAAQAFAKSFDAAHRSVQLDPGLAETHTALGQIHMFYKHDYVWAESEFALARAANERYARLWHHLGILRAFQGRPDEALAAMRRARELEPMTLLFNANYGLVLYHSRRYDEVIAHLEPLLASQPTLDQARSTMIRALIAKGEFTRAQEHLALRRGEKPNLSDAGLLYAHTGEREKALQEIARIERMSAQGFAVGYELTVLRAAIGDMAGGCAALQLAVRDHSPFLGWMRLDPRLDPLRGEPCFETVEAWLGSGKPLGQ